MPGHHSNTTLVTPGTAVARLPPGMWRALIWLSVLPTLVMAEAHLSSGESAARIGAAPLPAPSISSVANTCLPERLTNPGPLPAPPLPSPSTPPTNGKPPADGVDCTSSDSKYGALLDFYDGTALVHDGSNNVTEVNACRLTVGATRTVDCTRGAGEYRLTYIGNTLDRVNITRNGQTVATLQCSAWKRPAPDSTCAAYWTGYYIHPFSLTCVPGGESGCSSPFAFSTPQQCEAALRDPSLRIPLGK